MINLNVVFSLLLGVQSLKLQTTGDARWKSGPQAIRGDPRSNTCSPGSDPISTWEECATVQISGYTNNVYSGSRRIYSSVSNPPGCMWRGDSLNEIWFNTNSGGAANGDGEGVVCKLPAPAPATQGASGDPHVKNIKGEKFDIVRTGSAPLVNVSSDGVAHLQVMALIEGVKKCRKKMFITEINASGSWLEKNVAVNLNQNDLAFNVMIDGQTVWSPARDGYAPPTTQNSFFNHASKFSIYELPAEANEPAIQLEMAHDIKMKIVRPLHRSSAPPHLNFDIKGLNTLPHTFQIGGLLGQDNHLYWSARDENCATFAQEWSSDQVGSIATAD